FTWKGPTTVRFLSLHDALPISFGFRLGFSLLLALGFLSGAAPGLFLTLACLLGGLLFGLFLGQSSGRLGTPCLFRLLPFDLLSRSEEHTSELQSRENLVCRLPL